MRTPRAVAALVAGAALALSVTARADVPISANARTHFKAGVALLQDPGGARYEEAYREFKAAYADSPSPRILGNVGLCAMKLERDGEAIQAYEGYLAGVPDLAPEERKQITTDLATLKAGEAHASFTVNVPRARVFDVRVPVQGSNVTNVYGPVDKKIDLVLRPGHHSVTVRAEGYPPATWEVDANPGATITHAFTLEKPVETPAAVQAAPPPVDTTPRTRPVPVSVFVVGGASLAAASAGVITGIVALGKNSDYQKANDGSDPKAAASLRSSGQTLNAVTDVLLGAAIVGAGITTYLYVARPSVAASSGGGPAREHGSLRLDLGMQAGLPGARLVGTF
ncbi:MAG TPA: hypothetical protein VHB21_28095 [Minicystis sp.]|nr:hypothetical protein [Minicystis sp.]